MPTAWKRFSRALEVTEGQQRWILQWPCCSAALLPIFYVLELRTGLSKMGRTKQALQGLVILCLMTACGGAASGPSSGADEIGFINQTNHSDDELWAIWKTAQQNIAQQVDLNPLQRSLHPGSAPHLLPGDSRALSIQPHQIAVQAKPDISSSKLFEEMGAERADPTGLIACPAPCNVRYAAAFSFYQHPYTQYAASWEFQGNNFYQILQYEFENHILNALGYDMTWR